MGKFRHLDVPRQWTETFTKYPHGLTIFEALVDWTSQVDKMVDNVNDWNEYLDGFVDNFEFELRDEVQQTITRWQNEGFLEVIINAALNTRLDEVEDVVENVQTSLNSRFIDVTNPGHPLEKAIGDGVTDNTIILQNIVDYCHDNNLNLYIPEGEYVIKDTLFIKENIKVVDMVGTIVYDGPHDRPAIQVGDENDMAHRNEYSFKVISKTQSNWSSEDFIGIKLINLYECLITRLISNNFTIGLQCYATNRGFVYNEIHLTTLYNNLIAVDLANETTDSRGWVNENLFIGGRITVQSAITIMPERIGVRIRSIDGTYTKNNNNLFLKTSFEMNGEAIPIVIVDGQLNQFESIRNEYNGPYVAKFLNDSTENIVNVGYGGREVLDLSNYPTNQATSRRNIYLNKFNQVFNSGNLRNMAIVNGNQVGFENVNVFDSSDGIPSQSVTAIVLLDYGISLPNSRGVGVRVRTDKVKEFIVKRNIVSAGGRINIAPYDINGNRLTGTNPMYVLGSIISSPYYNAASYGGVYRTGSDSDVELYFKVRDEVAYVDIIISGGDLIGFTVECIDHKRVAIPYKVLE